MRSRLLLLAWSAAATVPAARCLGAQEVALATTRSIFTPRVNAVIVAPALLITTTPPAFETVEISRPAELPPGGAVAFVVTPMSDLRILGRLAGSLPAAGDSSGMESLLLTFAVPRRVEAGILEVARVRFTAAGAAPVDVPVRLQVGAAPGIDLVVPGGTQRVASAGRLILRYGVVNGGNRTESVTITVVAPAGWNVQPPEARLELQVGAVAERTVALQAPADESTGSSSIQFIASVAGVPLARAAVTVLVVPSASRTSDGPTLTTGMALASGTDGPLEVWSASLHGPISQGIRVSGRISYPEAAHRHGNLALYRVGGEFMQPTSLAIESASWGVTAGHRAFPATELTGSGISGNGFSSSVRSDRWQLAAFSATPGLGEFDRREGRLAGVRTEFDAGPAVLSASGVHLTERGFEDRALDAWGVGAELPSIWRGTLTSELAHRRSTSGSGLGLAMAFARQTPDDHVRVRLLRAPGGRAAFAQAREQFGASIGRRLGERVGLFGDWWTSRDGASASLSGLRSSGISTGARISLTRQLGFGLGFRHAGFAVRAVAGGMESGESGIEANVDYHGRVAFLSLRSSAGTATRRTQTPDDIAPLTEVGRTVSLGGTLGARLGRGTVHLAGRYDRTESGVGGLPERAEVSLRLDRLALVSRGEFHLQANAEIRKSFLTGLGPVGLAASTGLEATLPYGLTIAWVAERNPYFLAIAGNGAWVHAVRIERRTLLPSVRRSGQRGIVYRDLNGNGRREAGESGLPGALVRQQGVQAVTGPDGDFRLDAAASGGEAALDPMSLNAGWIAGRRSDAAGRLELAVVPVAPIVVLLSVADPQGIGVGTDTLGPAAVLARHESGRLWVARRSGADSATFDALPPGRYDLQLDLTEVGVPLTVVGSLPSFVVGAVPPEPIHVVLSPRQVHVRQLDSPPPTNPPGAR